MQDHVYPLKELYEANCREVPEAPGIYQVFVPDGMEVTFLPLHAMSMLHGIPLRYSKKSFLNVGIKRLSTSEKPVEKGASAKETARWAGYFRSGVF